MVDKDEVTLVYHLVPLGCCIQLLKQKPGNLQVHLGLELHCHLDMMDWIVHWRFDLLVLEHLNLFHPDDVH